jgi:hypothetical protein
VYDGRLLDTKHFEVAFVGFRILPKCIHVRQTGVRRAKRRLKDKLGRIASVDDRLALVDSVRSTFAHWAHADSWRLREQTLRELGLHVTQSDDVAPRGTE